MHIYRSGSEAPDCITLHKTCAICDDANHIQIQANMFLSVLFNGKCASMNHTGAGGKACPGQ